MPSRAVDLYRGWWEERWVEAVKNKGKTQHELPPWHNGRMDEFPELVYWGEKGLRSKDRRICRQSQLRGNGSLVRGVDYWEEVREFDPNCRDRVTVTLP